MIVQIKVVAFRLLRLILYKYQQKQTLRIFLTLILLKDFQEYFVNKNHPEMLKIVPL